MYASTPTVDPHSTILPRYHSRQIPTQADCSGQNYTRFKNADADRAIEEAGATLDLEKRRAAYAKVMRLLNDAYVTIWMYDRANIDARVTGLQGWQTNTWRRFTWNLQDWWIKK
jgi:peptide/nickel transport system substrate-binding protein